MGRWGDGEMGRWETRGGGRKNVYPPYFVGQDTIRHSQLINPNSVACVTRSRSMPVGLRVILRTPNPEL